jgi:hypothetical protein
MQITRQRRKPPRRSSQKATKAMGSAKTKITQTSETDVDPERTRETPSGEVPEERKRRGEGTVDPGGYRIPLDKKPSRSQPPSQFLPPSIHRLFPNTPESQQGHDHLSVSANPTANHSSVSLSRSLPYTLSPRARSIPRRIGSSSLRTTRFAQSGRTSTRGDVQLFQDHAVSRPRG